MAIGIFDSGIGGITILSKIRDMLPRENLFYVADQAHVPYAKKSATYLKNRAEVISLFFLDKGCSSIVVACNTATVATIEFLREKFPQINFIGMEPAIKPASTTAKKDILVLATKHTLQSNRLRELIDTHASQKTVHLRDVPEWVDLAELGNMDDPQAYKSFDKILKTIDNDKISDVVLACTHYPYFKPIIVSFLSQVIIHDPSIPVARQVEKTHNKTAENKMDNNIFAYSTSKNSSSMELLSNLLPPTAKIQSISL